MSNKFIYFSDTAAGAVELAAAWYIDAKEFAEKFPGVKPFNPKGCRLQAWIGHANGKELYPVTRIIRFKKCPSLHVCNAKCMGGKVDGTCECQCGGKNHGRAGFTVAGV